MPNENTNTALQTTTCPHCEGVIEGLRGECPHCKADLNADGFRVTLEHISEKTEGVHAEITKTSKTVEELLARVEKLEDLNQQRVENHAEETGGKVPQVNVMKLIRGITSSKWENAELEQRVYNESEDVARQMGMATVATGGALVPAQYLAEQFIDLLYPKTVVKELGATMLDGLTGSPVEISRLATGSVADWVDENNPKPETDLEFEKINLTPHELAAFGRISNRLVMLSNPSITTLFSNDLSRAIAGAWDLAALRGTGAGAQPVGIANTPGINVHTINGDVGNGAVITVDDLYDMLLQVELSDADEGKLGFAINPRTFNTLRKQRSDSGAGAGTGDYLLQPNVTEITRDMLIGYPYKRTTRIPINLTKGTSNNCSEAYFGNWEELLIAMWGSLEIRATQEAGDAFRYNQTWVRASVLTDIALRHAASFCYANGVLP